MTETVSPLPTLFVCLRATNSVGIDGPASRQMSMKPGALHVGFHSSVVIFRIEPRYLPEGASDGGVYCCQPLRALTVKKSDQIDKAVRPPGHLGYVPVRIRV